MSPSQEPWLLKLEFPNHVRCANKLIVPPIKKHFQKVLDNMNQNYMQSLQQSTESEEENMLRPASTFWERAP